MEINMLDLISVIRHSEERIKKQIDSAVNTAKMEDRTRVDRRKNEAYFNVLVRASLGISQAIEIDTYMQALCVAAPELLFKGIYKLGYGEARNSKNKKKEYEYDCPLLLKQYYDSFRDESTVKEPVKLISAIKNGMIDKALLCHGLSAGSDTILLLADLGRSVRISYALGLENFEIMLADVSWIKHNRSLNKLYSSPRDFVDELRICIDKRKRLYEVLDLHYTTYGISEKLKNNCYISRSNLTEKMSKWRDLANVIWGKEVLDAHSIDMKRAIGTSFEKLRLRKDNKYLTNDFKMLLSVNNDVPKKMEEILRSELSALRTISELFSTFDEDIFMYYFAQYFAQSQYSNYIKIANISEKKFDDPFSQKNEEFSNLVGATDDLNRGNNDNIRNFQLYLPWYHLGEMKLLPYTSTSGDVLKDPNFDYDVFAEKTILITDYEKDNEDKVRRIIKETPTAHRNRLVSDILSFIRLLLKNELPDVLKQSISVLSEDIVSQLCSKEDDVQTEKAIYSEWLQSIGRNDAVMPFHLIPYFWEEDYWDEEKINAFSNVIIEVLKIICEICE